VFSTVGDALRARHGFGLEEIEFVIVTSQGKAAFDLS
jgi:hypothetical protein